MLVRIILFIGKVLYLLAFPSTIVVGVIFERYPNLEKKFREWCERHRKAVYVTLVIYTIWAMAGVTDTILSM